MSILARIKGWSSWVLTESSWTDDCQLRHHNILTRHSGMHSGCLSKDNSALSILGIRFNRNCKHSKVWSSILKVYYSQHFFHLGVHQYSKKCILLSFTRFLSLYWGMAKDTSKGMEDTFFRALGRIQCDYFPHVEYQEWLRFGVKSHFNDECQSQLAGLSLTDNTAQSGQ